MYVPKISYEHYLAKYLIQKEIGEGGYGKIHSAIERNSGKPVVIKEVHTTKSRSSSGESNRDSVPREVLVMGILSSTPGVVKIIEYVRKTASYIIIMHPILPTSFLQPRKNLQPVTDLYKRTQSLGPPTEGEAKDILKQLLNIIKRIRRLGIYHRDIKEENIIIDNHTNKITLIDFGCAALMSRNCKYIKFRGTLTHAPPEWFTKGSYKEEEQTVWSIGITLYTLLLSKLPFESEEETKRAKLRFPQRPKITTEARNLIEQCLRPQEKHRITLEGIMSHQWLSQVKPLRKRRHSDTIIAITSPSLMKYVKNDQQTQKQQQNQSKKGIQ